MLAIQLRYAKEKPKVLILSEKVKILNITRKLKNRKLRLLRKIYGMNKSIHEIMEKKKKIHTSFEVAFLTEKVVTTVCGKYFVKIEKAFNLWVEDTNRNVFQLTVIGCA